MRLPTTTATLAIYGLSLVAGDRHPGHPSHLNSIHNVRVVAPGAPDIDGKLLSIDNTTILAYGAYNVGIYPGKEPWMSRLDNANTVTARTFRLIDAGKEVPSAEQRVAVLSGSKGALTLMNMMNPDNLRLDLRGAELLYNDFITVTEYGSQQKFVKVEGRESYVWKATPTGNGAWTIGLYDLKGGSFRERIFILPP